MENEGVFFSIARASILFTYFGLNEKLVAFLFCDKIQNSELLWGSETWLKFSTKMQKMIFFFFPIERTLHIPALHWRC